MYLSSWQVFHGFAISDMTAVSSATTVLLGKAHADGAAIPLQPHCRCAAIPRDHYLWRLFAFPGFQNFSVSGNREPSARETLRRRSNVEGFLNSGFMTDASIRVFSAQLLMEVVLVF
jgi:hypothetical protein